ncbi:unnamed protein product [Durusdinium trenchii]|uniref:Uncharacterized protein n=1 Tax=Durusdinium trenchii TaxID=1381693 RepID=A0ABP0QLR4_9DINO
MRPFWKTRDIRRTFTGGFHRVTHGLPCRTERPRRARSVSSTWSKRRPTSARAWSSSTGQSSTMAGSAQTIPMWAVPSACLALSPQCFG